MPDYEGIEIKTLNERSRYNMGLFYANPDGDYLFPLEKVFERLSYPSKKDPKLKILSTEMSGKYYSNIGYYKKVKLMVDRPNEKIYLLAMRDNKKLDISVSWSFEMIEQRLNLKLQYLAIITTKSRRINDNYYFLFDKIDFYKLKSFDAFIKLVEEGRIWIRLHMSSYLDKDNCIKVRNKGTAFTIQKEAIEELFEKIKK